jgi:hypothetical protein
MNVNRTVADDLTLVFKSRREEIKRLREVNAVLLAALMDLEDRHLTIAPYKYIECDICETRQTIGTDVFLAHDIKCPFAAIAKAKGGSDAN